MSDKYKPQASGKALETVNQNKPNDIILFGSWFCPFVQRVWTLLEFLGVSYSYVEVPSLYEKPKLLLQVSPKGLVPAIIDTKKFKTMTESLDIMKYLVENYANKSDVFKVPDNLEAAEERMKKFDRDVLGKIYHCLMSSQDPEALKTAKPEMFKAINEFYKDTDLKSDLVSLVDLAAAPFMYRFMTIQKEYCDYKVEELENEDLINHFKFVTERPEFTKTLSGDEEMRKVYERYAENKSKSQLAEKVRQENSQK